MAYRYIIFDIYEVDIQGTITPCNNRVIKGVTP